MSKRVAEIQLNTEDDIISIRDQLNFVRDKRMVLLILPPEGDLLADRVDLMLLRRHADRLRLAVGLVTADSRVLGPARELSIPTFATVQAGLTARRAWYRWRKRRSPGGKPTRLDDADRLEMQRRMAPPVSWQRWLMRYVSIILFFITLSMIFVAVVYVVPGATITLQPEIRPIQVTKAIVADPYLESVDYSGSSVPGRELVFVGDWLAEVETTGTIEVPDAPARGKVIFINQLEQPVRVPAGTRVSTSAGRRIVFQTLVAAEIPGVEGGTAEVDVVAIEPGPQNNVGVNMVNKVEGILSLQINVRNLEPLVGGGIRLARSVTEADQARLRAQVLQHIQAMALLDMETSLRPGEFLAQDSLRVVTVINETYSHFPGEQTDRLILEMSAEVRGTAVDETQASGLMYQELSAAIEPGFDLVPDSVSFHSGSVIGVDSQGRVFLNMIAEATTAVHLELAEPITMIVGQKEDVAMAYLYENLDLRAYPDVVVWPGWFERMPYLLVRIKSRVETE